MTAAHDPYSLPMDLPAPKDDGACEHLLGMDVPHVALPSTSGYRVDLREAAALGTTVFYVYPRTGRPGIDPPPGWDDIPGARGCTPQSCAFRDHFGELRALGATVYGISAQSTEEQREFAQRVGLPYPLLSDDGLELARTMRMPTFEVDGTRYYKRVTLIAIGGGIAKVFLSCVPAGRQRRRGGRVAAP